MILASVRASFSCQLYSLESPGKGISMKDCVDSLDSRHVCGDYLDYIIQVRKPAHCGKCHACSGDSKLSKSGERELSGNMHTFIALFF